MTFPRLERLKYSLLNVQLVVDKINNVEARLLNKSNMQVIFSNLLKPETLIDQMFYNITAICIAKAKKGPKNIHYLCMQQDYFWKGSQLFEVFLGCSPRRRHSWVPFAWGRSIPHTSQPSAPSLDAHPSRGSVAFACSLLKVEGVDTFVFERLGTASHATCKALFL